jgi:hypothetical protein
MNARALALVLLLLAASSAWAQQAPPLSERSYTKLRDYVLPDEREDAWRKIEWKSTFWDAVVEAQKAEKPILLWAMNGHPLGHT